MPNTPTESFAPDFLFWEEGIKEHIPKGVPPVSLPKAALESPLLFADTLRTYLLQHRSLQYFAKRITKQEWNQALAHMPSLNDEGLRLRSSNGVAAEILMQRLVTDMIGHLQSTYGGQIHVLMPGISTRIDVNDYGLRWNSLANAEIFRKQEGHLVDRFGEADLLAVQKTSGGEKLFWLDATMQSAERALENKEHHRKVRWPEIRSALRMKGPIKRTLHEICIAFGAHSSLKIASLENEYYIISVPAIDTILQIREALLDTLSFKEAVQRFRKNTHATAMRYA